MSGSRTPRSKSPRTAAREAQARAQIQVSETSRLLQGPFRGVDPKWKMPVPPNRRASLTSPSTRTAWAPHIRQTSRSLPDIESALLGSHTPSTPPEARPALPAAGSTSSPPTSSIRRRRSASKSGRTREAFSISSPRRRRENLLNRMLRSWMFRIALLLLIPLIILLAIFIPKGGNTNNKPRISARRAGGTFASNLNLYEDFASYGFQPGNLSSYLSYNCSETPASILSSCRLTNLTNKDIPLEREGVIISMHDSSQVDASMNAVKESCTGQIAQICDFFHYLAQGQQSNNLHYLMNYQPLIPSPSIAPSPSTAPSLSPTATASQTQTANCSDVICVPHPASIVKTPATITFYPFQLLGLLCTRLGIPVSLNYTFAQFGFIYPSGDKSDQNYINTGCAPFNGDAEGQDVVCTSTQPIAATTALTMYQRFRAMMGPDVEFGDNRTMTITINCNGMTQYLNNSAISIRTP